ncbi:MAG TPA: hypothetical protein VF133_17900 [Terriglobales bacterium]
MSRTIHDHGIELLTVFGYFHLNQFVLGDKISLCFTARGRRAGLEKQAAKQVRLPKIVQTPEAPFPMPVVFFRTFNLLQPTRPYPLQVRLLAARNDYVLITPFRASNDLDPDRK